MIVPVVEEPPATPLTAHVTAVFALPVTVAEKDCVFESSTLDVAGATVTVTCGAAVRVTVAWPKAVESATEVARIVMVGDTGMVAGAV